MEPHPAIVRVQVRALLTTALLNLGSALVAAQPIHFTSEDIRLHIAGDSCEITGTYIFTNRSDSEAIATLRYPFALAEALPRPLLVEVQDGSADAAIDHRDEHDAVVFLVTLPARSARAYTVRYWQRTPAETMTYLLTTTRRWGEPLDDARFVIELPDSFLLSSSTYALTEEDPRGGLRLYRFSRTHFMPRHDLTVTWRRASP